MSSAGALPIKYQFSPILVAILASGNDDFSQGIVFEIDKSRVQK